jgi:hypothetical protein
MFAREYISQRDRGDTVNERTDLRALRLKYAGAIAAADAAEEAERVAQGDCSWRDAANAHLAACRVERAAGRAYMEALDAIDPACSVCGCTTDDACDEGCWWAQLPPAGPPLCSSCVSKAR